MWKLWKIRKKGFTLIELMVAIAFLAIIFPAITSAFVTAQRTMDMENATLETIAQTQYLMQSLQVQGVDGISVIYDKYKLEGSGKASMLIFYEDNDEIESTITKLSDKAKLVSEIHNVLGVSGAEPDAAYAENLMSGAGIDRSYGVHVTIRAEQLPEGEGALEYFKVYNIEMKAWKVKGPYSAESRRVVYIGE